VRTADNLPPSCAVVTKSGSLNFLEPSGPVQAGNGMLYLYLFAIYLHRYSRKVSVNRIEFYSNLDFFDDIYFFSKNIEISNSMQIRPLEAMLFHAGGQTHTR